MSEATTTEAVAQAPASFTQADMDAAVARGIAQAEEARRARKAAKRASAGAPAETAQPAAAAVTETVEQQVERLVAARVAALAPAAQEPAAPAVAETVEQQVERLVTARLQGIAESGGVTRKGLVTEHSAARADGDLPAGFPMKDGQMIPMERWTDEHRQAVGAVLQTHVLGDKAVF